ncbi:hypothetical protein FP744_10007955 [Trichoderma asperellum]|nr:hypothetical protein LI328DRAFT_160705 [Trichoderma asperelloides]
MPPEDKESNAVDTQDGPERFAPWYRLLQKIRQGDSNQQHHDPFIVQERSDQSEEREAPDWLPADAEKVFVNKLVPQHEYPAVQLQNGILTPQLSRPPRNLAWLQARLQYARTESEWTLAMWQKYKAYPHFRRHRDLARVAMRYLFRGFPERARLVRMYYQRWYDFPEYAPFAQGLEQPCPGYTQGFSFEAYRAVDIECLGAAVCYSSILSGSPSLTLPHMTGEFAVGALEAEEAKDARHGAALVYIRNETLLHARIRKDPEDMAAIVTFITDGLSIRFYAHYESKSPSGRVEYHQYPILAANLVGSYEEFLRGVAMLRNCQDIAFVLANNLKNALERYHTTNGIDAWAYHLDDGDHILSESEDSVIEGISGQEDEVQQGNETVSKGNDDSNNTCNPGNSPNVTTQEKGDEGEGDATSAHTEKNEDDSPSPNSLQAQQPTRVLRPRKQTPQEEKKPKRGSRKRQASQASGDAGKEPSRKRLRPRS